ncbi:hypothetical protein ACE6H2_016984 [Prunus campanulata]
MLKAVGLFGRKKTTRQFKDFYAEWFNTLKNTLLPSLRSSMSESDSSLTRLSTQMEALHLHFQSYYDALDLAAQNDVAQLLCPTWRNPLEKPFLFLGDFHPYLFTNLLRSFLTQNDTDSDNENDGDSMVVHCARDRGDRDSFDRPWHIATAWRSPSYNLMERVEQVERGLRLMVPALAGRARDAQVGFLEHVARNWAFGTHKATVEEAMAEQNEEMVGVFVDANRLRKSVLVEIVGATNVYQGALFLEGLAQFLVGFRDPELLAQFELCKTPLSKQSRLGI